MPASFTAQCLQNFPGLDYIHRVPRRIARRTTLSSSGTDLPNSIELWTPVGSGSDAVVLLLPALVVLEAVMCHKCQCSSC